MQARVRYALALGQQAPATLLVRAQFGQFGGVARRIGAPLVQPQLHRLQVARQVLQLSVWRAEQKTLGQQVLQLLLNIARQIGRRATVFELARGGGVFAQNQLGAARNIG